MVFLVHGQAFVYIMRAHLPFCNDNWCCINVFIVTKYNRNMRRVVHNKRCTIHLLRDCPLQDGMHKVFVSPLLAGPFIIFMLLLLLLFHLNILLVLPSLVNEINNRRTIKIIKIAKKINLICLIISVSDAVS